MIFIASLSTFSTKVYPHREHFVHFDSSIKLFFRQHLPYLLISVLSVSVVITASLLLTFYPTKFVRRILECCLHLKCRLALHAFVENFQGHYKDGTNGTRDYRAVSGLQFCLQVIFVACYSHAKVRFYFISYLQILLTTTTLFYAYTQPCKTRTHNILLCFLFYLTTFILQMIFFNTVYALATMLILLLIPHFLYFTLKVFRKLWMTFS